ncbi:hypothetical protein [Bacillus sp. FJAT-44742]|uniref:hypothetical protein n=1 Tax=Bacillus sp. FJAT-44742 TaxID=2014005 RepID=UPI000C23042D|nr:hypothetical protein [Bacillus sp. FJAT-44742]
MTNLREIVRRHTERETKEALMARKGSEVIADSILEELKSQGNIDKEVDKILDAFREEIEKDSPKAKRKKKYRFYYLGGNLFTTTGIAISVNQEAWTFTVILSMLALGIYSFFTFSQE